MLMMAQTSYKKRDIAEFKMSAKPVHQLSILDFQTHPVWTWVEDDGNLVEPIHLVPNWQDQYDTIFVLGNFMLHDGTSAPGTVAIRARDLAVYLVSISTPIGQLVDLPPQPLLMDNYRVSKETLASMLHKSIWAVFPITFQTSLPIDRKPISGTIR